MTLGRDAAILLLGAVIALWISESFPKTLEERKAERRATEFKFQQCLAACNVGCGK